MYRNTKKVVSFLQHAVKDMDVTYGNYMDGDGIHCTVMRNLLKNVPENSLAQYLRPLLVHSGLSPEAKYQVTDIAVLLDAGYTDGQIVDIRQILGSQLPGITTHASDKFLREGIVVDRIESFIGLDAGLCIFLLSPTLEHRIVEDPCYRVFLASRATHRAVFVVSKIDAAFAESMKFDRFQGEAELDDQEDIIKLLPRLLEGRSSVQMGLETYTDYCFSKDVSIHRPDLKSLKEIAELINGLMNTSGGLIVLHCGVVPLDKHRDQWLMVFKEYVTRWIPNHLYRSLVKVLDKIFDSQHYLILFVSKSRKLVTFSYNAYGRHPAGIDNITSEDEVKQILQMADEGPKEKPSSQLADLLANNGSFTLGEELPVEYWESATLGYRYYNLSNFNAVEIAEKLERLRLCENISAFANTRGGSLVVGVQEGNAGPVVNGYPVTENQGEEERKLTIYINTELRKCIWRGEVPNHDRYWNVFYHDVKSGEQNDRKIIEISTHQVSGGMFFRAPLYYTVEKSDKGKASRLVEVTDFDTWRRRFTWAEDM